MTAPTFVRSMAVALAPLTVGCTFCLAPRGSNCRSTGTYKTKLHAARIAAVAHLSEQQRYDAYAAMRAEEAALRAQVSAQLAKPLPADVEASRRRTAATWDRVGREAAAEVASVRRRPLSPIRGGTVVVLATERMRRRSPLPNGVA